MSLDVEKACDDATEMACEGETAWDSGAICDDAIEMACDGETACRDAGELSCCS